MKDIFRCLVYNPAGWNSVKTAVAAIRAGGSGVICMTRGDTDELALFDQARKFASDGKHLGLRLSLEVISRMLPERLMLILGRQPGFLVITGGYSDFHGTVPQLQSHPLVWEITDISEMEEIRKLKLRVDGWVLAGEEAGGRAGTLATTLFLQKAVQISVREPLIVRGGFGIIGAAGLMAAGASGVVMDDQLLLLKESPWSGGKCPFLWHLNGQECALMGERYGAGYRFLNRPEFPGARRLVEHLRELEGSDISDAEVGRCWREEIEKKMRWSQEADFVWPLGQAAGLAAGVAEEFQTTGKLVQGILFSIAGRIRQAGANNCIGPDTPLARSHKTRYPIVQGPMTRVSDNPAFAREVGRAGGLPLIALAAMKEDAARKVLEETARQMDNLPWGAGVLGFLPPELRTAQFRVLSEVKPKFVLIAGGTPDQVRQLESEGMDVYVHAPSPALISLFLRQNVRRFVVEGHESGGHVGPLGSLVLWEHAVRTLLKEVRRGEESKIHVLFAGGIHDARSGAIVSLFASALSERSFQTGVLMGSAYIFTKEVVASGAVVEEFQRQTLHCRTTTLEASPSYVERVAESPFVAEFQKHRRKLIRDGVPLEKMKWELESFGLGRLRLATRGLERDQGGNLVTADRDRQLRSGMYMIGQAASLHGEITTIAALHAGVAEGSQQVLKENSLPMRIEVNRQVYAPRPADIAVIGMACMVPGSSGPEQFWENLLANRSFITEIPKKRFDWRIYYDPDKNTKDKCYSKWGGFMEDVPIDPLHFGIPPKLLKSISSTQIIALEAVRRVLADAGLSHMNFDRENTEIILGAGEGGGMMNDLLGARTTLPLLFGYTPAEIDELLPEWTSESFTGLISNITAGRVANRFDFGGANFTVSAACASSLTALDLAVKDLEARRCNLAIAGGIDSYNSPFFYVAFSKCQALSPDGKIRTFDKKANGIVISEGAAFVVLKRLEDAERDGDHIYGVIKSIATSSDGKELGLTAPNSHGQLRVLQRAYRQAGFGVDTIGFYEAHGTGTTLGDRTEVESIVTFLKSNGAEPGSCAIGSHKTLIGHTKIAAGLVGIIKGLMSLSHRTLPPHAGVEDPLDPIADPNSPVVLLDAPKPWLANECGPRRCGVSAFGFGGINVHAVLEEYCGAVENPVPGGPLWPCELLLLRAQDRNSLIGALENAIELCKRTSHLHLVAAKLCHDAAGIDRSGPALSVVAVSLSDAITKLNGARAFLTNGDNLPPKAFYSDSADTSRNGKVALMFPGQGSQYPGMLQQASVYLQDLRGCLEGVDSWLRQALRGRLSDRIFPGKSYHEATKQRQIEEIKSTHISQPALAAIALGLLQLLRHAGLKAEFCGGHSFGEWCALCAAGVLSEKELILFAEKRGRIMHSAGKAGAMIAVATLPETAASLASQLPGLTVANINSPKQSVLSGSNAVIQQATQECSRRGIQAILLPVSGAFHSPLVEPAAQPLIDAIQQLAFTEAVLPVYSNETGTRSATSVIGLRKQMETHLLRPVQFLSMVQSMHNDGARIFVEVGANRVLGRLMGQCLEGCPHQVVSLDDGTGSLASVLAGIGALACMNAISAPGFLWDERVHPTIPDSIREKTPAVKLPDWFVNGMYVWSGQESYGKKPLPDADMIAAATQRRSAMLPAVSDSVAVQNATPSGLTDPATAAYAVYQDTMRQFLRTQEQVVSMLLNGQPLAAPSSAAVSMPPGGIDRNLPSAGKESIDPSRSQSAGFSGDIKQSAENSVSQAHLGVIPTREEIANRLVKTMSSLTGYPSEMLALERDIEGELGIDSIKRMEILHEFQRSLPSELVNALVSHADTLSRSKTLQQLVERIDQVGEQLRSGVQPNLAAATDNAPPKPSDETKANAQVAVDLTQPVAQASDSQWVGDKTPVTGPPQVKPAPACPRFVMRCSTESARSTERPLAGLFLVTMDEMGVAQLVGKRLAEAGAIPRLLTPDELETNLKAVIAQARATHGPVRGIIHLRCLSNETELPDTFPAWRQSLKDGVKALFELVKTCHGDLATPRTPAQNVMAVSMMGGSFGRKEEQPLLNPAAGACPGFLNTLKIELPALACKTVDLDPLLSHEHMCKLIVDELTGPEDAEVGFPGGERTTFKISREEIEFKAHPAELPDDSVILATGGASGITAAILNHIARPGMRAIIAGRSKWEAEAPEIAALKSPGELRDYFITAKRGTLSTPALIEQKIGEIMKSRERQASLNALKERGVAVEYIPTDVKNENAMRSLLERIYTEHGKIDTVLHGSGIIADKLISDKSRLSFDEVFDTKADSTYLLAKYLIPKSLKQLILFGSVAGRFGNRGQCDYASANELLNRMAWWLRRKWPHCHVVCINWGPWAETGMASAAVNQKFVERGIVPISTSGGCEFVMREISAGRQSQAEVIAGQCNWSIVSS